MSPMAFYRVAVLKCTWSDTVYNGSTPQGLTFDDWVLNRLFLPLSPWWGVATYWEHCSYGTINLQGSEIFPWRKLDGFPAPTAAGMYGRFALAQQAVKQAKAEGWPLDQFDAVVVWVAPSITFPQDAGSTPALLDGKPFCTVYEGSRHDFYTHEFGHALRFVHPWGSSGNATTPDLPYRDPYCVMSAMGYAGTNPLFSIAADPDGPPAGQIFWSSLPPMPSAATMYVTVPDFATSRHVLRVGTIAAGWQRSVRIRARDLVHGNDPALAVANAGPGVTGGRKAFTVELRRGRGWDRAVGSAVPGTVPPPAGLVIHSLRDLDEFPGASWPLELNPLAYYEGNVPIPLVSTDNDWASPNGFVVRIDDVADDLSWVDVTLGGADLDRDGAVTLDIVTGGWNELFEEGFAEDVRVFVCGTGDYRYTIDHQHTQLTCSPTTFGYEQPAVSWRINGVQLPPGQAGSVSLPAVATFPGPKSSSKGPRTVTLTWQRADSTLVLGADPADGNYWLDIEATAIETHPAAATSPSSTTASAQVTGILLGWEQAYYDALNECVRRVRDINDRFAKSQRFPRLNPGDPITRVSAVVNQMRDDLGAARPFLLAELDHVAETYAAAQTSRQLRVHEERPATEAGGSVEQNGDSDRGDGA
ncbi:MAG: hypothetical protein ACRDOT_02745 [Aeromicrobium sp.]